MKRFRIVRDKVVSYKQTVIVTANSAEEAERFAEDVDDEDGSVELESEDADFFHMSYDIVEDAVEVNENGEEFDSEFQHIESQFGDPDFQ